MVNFKSLTGHIDFYFVRHGKSTGNMKNIIQGHSDYPLSEEGKKQAARAGTWFLDKKIDIILTSPLSRAKETATIIAEKIGIDKVSENNLLKELNTGIFSDTSADELPRSQPAEWANFQKHSWDGVTGAEKSHEIFNRAVLFWEKLFEMVQKGNSSIISVAHAGILQWIFKVTFNHKEWLPLFPMSNAGISLFSVNNQHMDTGRTYMYRWVFLDHVP